MGVLQRKKDGTEVISVRVPRAIHEQLIELRRRSHLLGFNFNATLAGVLGDAAKQIHQELANEEQKIHGVARTARLPGAGGKAA
jgi:hypothetical protein